MTKMNILIINPNSSSAMTTSLQTLITSHYSSENTNLHFTYFTAPSGPASINNDDDGNESLQHCVPALEDQLLRNHDATIVACYSDHPLVPHLRQRVSELGGEKNDVMGIFEASVRSALRCLRPGEKWGIVSTGSYWEVALSTGVANLGIEGAREGFAGVETTGLNAAELHERSVEEVKEKMEEATRRLMMREDVGVVVLGCAGMSGLGDVVRGVGGEGVRIVDGVLAAVELVGAGAIGAG